MSGIQTGFLDNLREAVRENPLAAALIGGGALWLLMGNERLKSAASSVSAATAPLADIGARNLRSAAPKFTNSPPTAPDMDDGSSQHVRETLHDATSAAVSDTAAAIKDRFEEGSTKARENIGKLGDALPRKETFALVQSSLSNLLERQPLLLGAMGLAIGAAVAGAFQTSDLENDLMGKLSGRVKEDLNARGDAVSQSVREASDTLKAEIVDMGAESLERLQETGRNAMDAARGKVKVP
jgi:sulfur transfer complex TusBCD TusB component (DsrH family)